MTKNFSILFFLTLVFLNACNGKFEDDITSNGSLQTLSLQLSYPEDSPYGASEGVEVTLTDNSGGVFIGKTDKNGVAEFKIPCGIYSASVSDEKGIYVFNGKLSDIIITSSKEVFSTVKLSTANINKVVIKELYCGGCQLDDGGGYTRHDKYVTVYNNSSDTLEINNFALGVGTPYNSSGTNPNYSQGELIYADQGFTPAAMGIWYYPGTLEFLPYEEKVISIYGAIDHTVTYSNSVNLAKKEYYVLYDETCEKYSADTHYYPAPYEGIPKSHYFRALVYGLGSTWIVSVTSPCFFVFTLDQDPAEFSLDENNHYFEGGKSGSWGAYGSCLKIPNKNILDALEVFTTRYDGNKKRLSPEIDGGYVWHTNQYGYTLYRNVNAAATEKLPENSGKIVYGYSLGTSDIEKGSTDPSGIDAEASIKNGAHIIYCNTNNSSNDFHQRRIAAIKD